MTETKPASYLFVINDGPYGNERPYNALRLAMVILLFDFQDADKR
jgi:sulfur relay (sulfurtransferase) complex TusBCD TusD component (DsrE family)